MGVTMMKFILMSVLLSFNLRGVYSVSVTSSGSHQRVKLNVEAIFYCNADVAINSCQFNVWDGASNNQLLRDYIRTLRSDWREVEAKFNVKDYETHLHRGRCGMSLQVWSMGHFLVGCRIQVEGQGWIYRYSTLSVSPDAAKNSQLVIDQDAVFASLGTDVQVTCSTPTRVRDRCSFDQIQGLARQAPSTSHGIFTCGATYHLTEDNSRLIWCTDLVNIRATAVIATKAPRDKPRIDVPASPDISAGFALLATCTVPESRPPATILWYVNDVLVATSDSEFNGFISTGYTLEEVTGDAWRWTWMAEGRKQMLRKEWTNQNAGKEVAVKCASNHSGVVINSTSWKVTPGELPTQFTTPRQVTSRTPAMTTSTTPHTSTSTFTHPTEQEQDSATSLITIQDGSTETSTTETPRSEEAGDASRSGDKPEKKSSLGIIIGVVIIIIILIVIGLVVYARMNRRWCFAGAFTEAEKNLCSAAYHSAQQMAATAAPMPPMTPTVARQADLSPSAPPASSAVKQPGAGEEVVYVNLVHRDTPTKPARVLPKHEVVYAELQFKP